MCGREKKGKFQWNWIRAWFPLKMLNKSMRQQWQQHKNEANQPDEDAERKINLWSWTKVLRERKKMTWLT